MNAAGSGSLINRMEILFFFFHFLIFVCSLARSLALDRALLLSCVSVQLHKSNCCTCQSFLFYFISFSFSIRCRISFRFVARFCFLFSLIYFFFVHFLFVDFDLSAVYFIGRKKRISVSSWINKFVFDWMTSDDEQKKKKDDFNVSFFFNFRFVVFSFIFEFAGLKILFYLLLYSSAFGLSWNRPNEFVPYFGISRDINTTTKYCVHNCTYDACKYFAW